MKKYAIRVFCNRHHTYIQPNVDVAKPNEDNKEEAVPYSKENVTIGDVMVETFPRLFETVLAENGVDVEIVKKRNFEVVTHGVEVDLKTPLYWMQLNMSYLDNFLYFSFHFY